MSVIPSPVPSVRLSARAGLLVALLVTVASTVARTRLDDSRGLHASYSTSGHTENARLHIDPQPTLDRLVPAFGSTIPDRFYARWNGMLIVPKTGTYTFALDADDGARLVINGSVIVDHFDEMGRFSDTGQVGLLAGPQQVMVEYTQAGGDRYLNLRWATGGYTPTTIPAWAFWTTPVSIGRARASQWLHPVPEAGALLVVLLATWMARGRVRAALLTPEGRLSRSVVRVMLLLMTVSASVFLAEAAVRFSLRTVRSSGDARSYFGVAPEALRVNNYGYRDPDIPDGPHSTYRIVVIGDSITWGQGLVEAERYTDRLRMALGAGYEVFNFGVSGRNLPDHRDLVPRALRLSPQFVLLQLYPNDWEIGDMDRPILRPLLPWPRLEEPLLAHSALYSLLSMQWMLLQPRLGMTDSYDAYMRKHLADPSLPQARRSTEMLQGIFRSVRAGGAEVGAIMFPNPAVLTADAYGLDFLHDRLQAVCRDEQVTCVDLRQPFRQHFRNLKEIAVSPLDGHPSPAANAVAADELLRTFGPVWTPLHP